MNSNFLNKTNKKMYTITCNFTVIRPQLPISIKLVFDDERTDSFYDIFCGWFRRFKQKKTFPISVLLFYPLFSKTFSFVSSFLFPVSHNFSDSCYLSRFTRSWLKIEWTFFLSVKERWCIAADNELKDNGKQRIT